MTGRASVAPTEASILDVLIERARSQPDRQIFCFLDDAAEIEHFTYAQLDSRARRIATELRRQIVPGDRVLLVYPPGLEFIAALFGCFHAGAIAVPVHPPRFGMTPEPLRALLAVVRDCRPAVLLTGGVLAEPMRAAATTIEQLLSIPCMSTDQWSVTQTDESLFTSVTRETIALLQYTSGSTGDPKGVVVTHGNLLANEHVIQLAFHHRTQLRPGTGVCWLPFYHDMGLIGNVIQAVYVDGPCYLMSPLVLLQRPFRWLQAISHYRAHSSGGPNFAYDLCVRRITADQKAQLDLSCWELAAIGAETISAETMERFATAFAECGFRKEAFYPCYGLAEATLFVSGGDKQALPVVRSIAASQLEYQRVSDENSPLQSSTIERTDEPARQIVGCGHAWTDHEIVIADPETARQCPDGSIGEIWFRGPSVASGYWEKPDDTEAAFAAFLSDSNRGPFLRTGDLGFTEAGELFVTGRLKDLIVIRGHNHYPQDIETTVCQLHESFRPNSGAAFGCLLDGEERLIVLQEIDRQTRKIDLEELKQQVRRAVAQHHQLEVYETVFLRNGTLPKTTSGKVRHHECRRRYLSRQLTLWTSVSPA